MPRDELMLFALSCVHNWHTIVYAKYRAWCTLNNSCQLPVDQIHDLCDMHLVYLGHNTYGKLHEKSTITPSIEVTQDMVNARLNCISSLHCIVDSLKTTASLKQPSMPGLVETDSSSVKDTDDTLSVSTLEPIFSSDTEPPDSVLSLPSTTSSTNVPHLVEILDSSHLDTENMEPNQELLFGSVVGHTTKTTSTTTSLVMLQSLTMSAQTTLVKAGMPLPDPETVIPYSTNSMATVLVRTTQPQPAVSDQANTGTSHSVPKLSDLSYAIVLR